MLYHKDIFLPEEIKKLDEITFNPVYSFHAKKASESDRYGYMILPRRIKFNGSNIIEAEIENGVKKLVIRVAYNDILDMIVVFIPESLLVKTVWFNLKTDKHKTLDKTKYFNPEIGA